MLFVYLYDRYIHYRFRALRVLQRDPDHLLPAPYHQGINAAAQALIVTCPHLLISMVVALGYIC